MITAKEVQCKLQENLMERAATTDTWVHQQLQIIESHVLAAIKRGVCTSNFESRPDYRNGVNESPSIQIFKLLNALRTLGYKVESSAHSNGVTSVFNISLSWCP